jgi:predicted phage-related endonuclease
MLPHSMGIILSNMFNYDTLDENQNNPIDENRNNPMDENRNNPMDEKYNNIISTLDKIESKFDSVENTLNEIEEIINNEKPFDAHYTMEWDYYDSTPVETKKIK